jgi:hypothetical protein
MRRSSEHWTGLDGRAGFVTSINREVALADCLSQPCKGVQTISLGWEDGMDYGYDDFERNGLLL